MGDFWRTTSKVLHNVAFGLHVVSHAIGRPHFHRPHFQRPFLDYRRGLRNWFHAQWHMPRRPHPLPPLYQTYQDRMVDRIMARAHNPKTMHRGPYLATPTYRHEGRA